MLPRASLTVSADYAGRERLAELAFRLAVVGVGVASIAWALVAKTYDDRWNGERDMDRFLRLGYRYDPVPMRGRDRIRGVVIVLAVVVGGVAFLVSQ